MTVSGSGVGGNIGGPQQPSQTEIAQTAWTQVNKAALNIVQDSLEIPFTQFGPDPKYLSSQTRSLQLPLESAQLDMVPPTSIDETWSSYFDNLIAELPSNVAAALVNNLSASAEDQNAALVALTYLLANTAKAIAWLEVVNDNTSPESPYMEEGSSLSLRTEDYQYLGTDAGSALVNDGSTLYSGASNYLSEIGPNDSNFDGLSNYVGEAGNGFVALSTLLSGATGSMNVQELYDALAVAMANASSSYQNTSLGNNLQILAPILEALGLVSSANALENGSPSLLISLAIALTGISTAESSAGVIGNSLGTVLTSLIEGMTGTFIPNADQGSQQLFGALVTVTLLVLIGGAALVSANGLGTLPQGDEVDNHNNQLFTVEMAALLVGSSGILNQTFASIGAACGASESGKQVIADAMVATALVLMLLVAAGKNEKDLNTLLAGLSTPLSQALEGISTFLNEALASGTISGNAAAGVTAYIQQAVIALQNGDFGNFTTALNAALALLGVTPETLQQDLQQISTVSANVWSGITTGVTNQSQAIMGLNQSA